jgi:hypothetical protein
VQIDERTRHEMYLGLEERLGPELADLVMAHLPPMGWADIATQREMNARFETVDRRLDEVRSLMLWLFSAQVAMTGVVLAIVKLT